MIFWIFFSYFVSHSWGIPMMKITGLSHIFKWENLPNWWLTKYFFAPLYTITHDFATGEKHIQLWQAAIRSGAIYCGTGRRPARQRGSTNRSEAVDRGRGVMSVIGEGARESPCSALPTVVYPAWPWPRPAGTGEPENIKLNCVFGANSYIPSQLFSLSILSILVSESINFHLQIRELHRDGIHIPVNSLSLNADRSSHSFNQSGQPCETLDSCSRLLNFSITQGKSNQQNTCYHGTE